MPQRHSSDLHSRLNDAVIMFIVTLLSLGLLTYVGIGEGKRTLTKIQTEKGLTQGRLIKNSLETFLKAGLPLQQFVGFERLAQPIVDDPNDDALDAMVVFDAVGRPLFTSVDRSKVIPPAALSELNGLKRDNEDFEVLETEFYSQIVLPLNNRFERAASLMLLSPRDNVPIKVHNAFKSILIGGFLLSVAFGGLVALIGPRMATRRFPWLHVCFALCFTIMAASVVSTLVGLYSVGIQAKSKAFADSLGQRLGDLMAFNIDLKQIDGLDKMFADYQRLNPEISAAGLIVDGVVQVHTTPSMVGKNWSTKPNMFEYSTLLSKAGAVGRAIITVAVPTELVFWEVAHSAKNFAALFVASAFMAGLFLQFAGSFRSRYTTGPIDPAAIAKSLSDHALDVVKPVFFITVFVEHLNYSFLPQFMLGLAKDAGISARFASLPFTLYYLAFAVTLIPAGYMTRRVGSRNVIWLGLLLSGLGILGLLIPHSFLVVSLTRLVAGIGQSMVFIGVQSFILAVAAPEKRTQANGIIVFGFQGGMISGMAIGSLLVNYVGAPGVFMIGGSIAATMIIYTLLMVPSREAGEPAAVADDTPMAILSRLGSDMRAVLGSRGFLGTILLIGIPAKAVLTGVIIFALPLILTQARFVQEDIGQIVMLYAAGVVVASHYASRTVDRGGRTQTVLFWGAALSAIGLLMIGFSGVDSLGLVSLGIQNQTIILLGGVVIVGVAHGLINAPVVTHIADSDLAHRIGTNSAAATYRFLERLGHIAGPIVVGQLFFFGGTTAIVLSWVGWIVLSLGFIFASHAQRSAPLGSAEVRR